MNRHKQNNVKPRTLASFIGAKSRKLNLNKLTSCIFEKSKLNKRIFPFYLFIYFLHRRVPVGATWWRHTALQHGEKAAWESSLEGKAIRNRHTGGTVGPMSLLQRRRGARWGDVRRLQGCGSAEHQTGPGLGQKVASLLAAHQAPFKTTRLWDCEQSNFFAKALTLYFLWSPLILVWLRPARWPWSGQNAI